MTDLIGFLQRHGCFETKHSGKSLGSHLLNTYNILKALEADEEVALAGGLHSIYGTNAFQRQTIQDRSVVNDAFGPRTERLAYLFGRIKRPHALETIPDDGGRVEDRLTGEVWHLDAKDVADLRLIEAANLMEQGGNIAVYPKICDTMAQRLNRQDDHG